MLFQNFCIRQYGIHVVWKDSWKNEKLESPKWNWKDKSWKVRRTSFGPKLESTTEVGKWLMKLESDLWSWKLKQNFQFQSYQLKTFQLLVLSNCPFQLHVSHQYVSFMPVCRNSLWLDTNLENENNFVEIAIIKKGLS